MFATRVFCFASLLLIALGGSPAAAQEATPEMLDAEARARFELAIVHIDNGRFEEAAREFQRAYELSGRDELLYNIYLAWRDGGFATEAADALAAYLETRAPDDPARPNLEARLRALRTQAAALQAAEPVAEDADVSLETVPPAPVPEPPSRRPSPVGWVVVGVGVAAGVTASVTGILAIEISDTLARDCAGGICPAARRFDAELGSNLAISTDVLVPVSVAALATGAMLVLLVTEETGPSDVAVGAACDGVGCQASLGGRFQ